MERRGSEREPLLPQQHQQQQPPQLDPLLGRLTTQREGSRAPERGERRSRSAQQMRGGAPGRPTAAAVVANPRNMKVPSMLPAQKPLQLRQKDKLVLLPRSTSINDTAGLAPAVAALPPQGELAPPLEWHDQQQQQQHQEQQQFQAAPASLFSDLAAVPDQHGRVTVYCIAESLKRPQLEELLRAKYPQGSINAEHAEFLHLALPPAQPKHQQQQQLLLQDGQQQQQQPLWEPRDCFFFDYGVVCLWGLGAKEETEVLAVAKKAQELPLPPGEVEVDHFTYTYSATSPPSMQNDCITISRHHATDVEVKVAIAHALAQSTKLCIYEERVVELVLETKHLPQALATHGTVHVTSQEIAQRIGQVFLQRSAVNLLSSVLDTPEFFWSSADHLQGLYERACDYLELDTRVEVLNARFQVLQEMLDMLRDHSNNSANARLEVIIIWLIAVELVVGVFELLGLFGFVGRERA